VSQVVSGVNPRLLTPWATRLLSLSMFLLTASRRQHHTRTFSLCLPIDRSQVLLFKSPVWPDRESSQVYQF